MLFRKLKKTWSHNSTNTEFLLLMKEIFPELSKVPFSEKRQEEITEKLIDLELDFYTIKRKKVSPLVRLTLPFSLILMVIMFIGLPFNFMVTGQWGYSFKKNNFIYNWFKKLGF